MKLAVAEPPRDVFDVGIEAAVLVNDEHGRILACRRRPREVALDRAVALRRLARSRTRSGCARRLSRPAAPRRSWAAALRTARHRQPADGELRGAVEERAPIDVAVHVLVKEVEQLLRKVGRLLSLHGDAPSLEGPAEAGHYLMSRKAESIPRRRCYSAGGGSLVIVVVIFLRARARNRGTANA